MTDKPIAAVTGAAQGIGLAIAKRLAGDGFHVLAMDRNAGQLEAAVAWWQSARPRTSRR